MSDTPGAVETPPPPRPTPPPSEASEAIPEDSIPTRPTLPSLTPGQIAALIAGAILTNVALRAQVGATSATMAVVLIAGFILGPRIRTSVTSSALALAAVLFAAWLPVRASTWLTGLNASAAVGFLIAAAATTQPVRIRLGTATVATLTSRVLQSRFFPTVFSTATQPLRLLQTARLLPLIRGVALAVIPVAVLATLLASADAVFAESLTTDLDLGSWISHCVLSLAAATGIAGLVAMLGVRDDEQFEDRRPLGSTEALVLLSSVGVLYAGFALVQLLSALGRADQILLEQGISYSEYARSGFFQLLWVAGLTLVLLTMVRVLVADGSSLLHKAVRVAGAVVSLLTTLIVATAVVRLGLYTEEFGQTTLRWYCTAFAWMLGVAFVLLAIGHIRRAESALPVCLMVLVGVTLLVANVLNPEARVAQHNLARADAINSLDADYLTGLSADAWPDLIGSKEVIIDQLPVGTSFDARCDTAAADQGYGVFGFNLAIDRVSCPSP